MTWTTRQHHTTELAWALSGLLNRSGVSMDMVSALGAAIGPGSFTSLRVGLSLVKGIALARRLPVIGIPTLDIIAAAQPVGKNSSRLVAVVRAGRTQVALGWYKNIKNEWQAEGEIRGATVDELADEIEEPTYVAGEYQQKSADVWRGNVSIFCWPHREMRSSPIHSPVRAWARWQENKVDDVASLAPVYLHVAGTPIQ